MVRAQAAHHATGAYALDAVPDDELPSVKAHLTQCPDCAREVAEFRETAARLAVAAAEPLRAPLRRQILDSLPDLDRRHRGHSAWRRLLATGRFRLSAAGRPRSAGPEGEGPG
ncbi:hypothetical protein POF50_034740 [Streptomyces sp. SL13]|uniref:Anti-sigma-K factor RskA N-terminal domain-containing protein n=1 Tax=Streptantibioticus silvisoli TaxID=2705255 RepID=A0AA90H5F3_9ACTN|nr:hypothetical protein [Streptantibioticus silvisoli]MDI5974448.1 hypothetical protein [Streptantibioticus silvisoli]